MTAKPHHFVIALMAVVIAALSWAVIYFARDEWHIAARGDEEALPVKSAVATEGGLTVVKVPKQNQQVSGIVVRELEAARAEGGVEVYGVVVSVQPLIELRARYLAAVSDARAVRAVADNSAAEYRRVKQLFEDDRNVSERVLQSAEAQWKADQARLAAANESARSVHASMRNEWGAALAEWGTRPESDAFDALAQQRDALLRVAFPYDAATPSPQSTLAVAPLAASGAARAARFVSAASQVDPTSPGVTYFYVAPAQGLREGMRLAGRLKQTGAAREGVNIPAAAVVWHAGKAWAYVQLEDDEFARKEVSTAHELPGGWFDAAQFKPGDEVVVSGAQLLLSEELKYQIRNENED